MAPVIVPGTRARGRARGPRPHPALAPDGRAGDRGRDGARRPRPSGLVLRNDHRVSGTPSIVRTHAFALHDHAVTRANRAGPAGRGASSSGPPRREGARAFVTTEGRAYRRNAGSGASGGQPETDTPPPPHAAAANESRRRRTPQPPTSRAAAARRSRQRISRPPSPSRAPRRRVGVRDRLSSRRCGCASFAGGTKPGFAA